MVTWEREYLVYMWDKGKKNPTLNMWSKKGRVIKNMLLTNKFSKRGMCLLGENRVKLKSGLCALAKIK